MESPVEAWKRHVLECAICGNAQSMGEMCTIAQHFWRPTDSAPESAPEPVTHPVPQVAPEPVVEVIPVIEPIAVAAPERPNVVPLRPQQQAYVPRQSRRPSVGPSPIEHVMGGIPVEAPRRAPVLSPVAVSNLPATIDPSMVNQIAERVSEKVIARSHSGAALAVPMEKTSTSVAIATAPGVVLHMPERDIEVYAEMKAMVVKLLGMADRIGKTIMVKEETKRHMRRANPGKELKEEEVALVVSQVGGQFGGNEEDLFYDFEEMAGHVLHLGDRLGSFMRVDDDTRRMMQRTRALAIEMQGEVERAYEGRLAMDTDTRKLVRETRLVALDLQGEIERRVGTS